MPYILKVKINSVMITKLLDPESVFPLRLIKICMQSLLQKHGVPRLQRLSSEVQIVSAKSYKSADGGAADKRRN
jgi:hypothetical protein